MDERERTTDRKMSGGDQFRVNDKVEARHRGGSKWYPGVVRLVDPRGTYCIRYADGDQVCIFQMS